MCDKTCIFFFFPIINKYFSMAKRSLLSDAPRNTSSFPTRSVQLIFPILLQQFSSVLKVHAQHLRTNHKMSMSTFSINKTIHSSSFVCPTTGSSITHLVFSFHKYFQKMFLGLMSIIVQQDATIYSFITFLQTALHVSGDNFTYHQKHV